MANRFSQISNQRKEQMEAVKGGREKSGSQKASEIYTEPITVFLTPRMKEDLQIYAKKNGEKGKRSMSNFIRMIIEKEIYK